MSGVGSVWFCVFFVSNIFCLSILFCSFFILRTCSNILSDTLLLFKTLTQRIDYVAIVLTRCRVFCTTQEHHNDTFNWLIEKTFDFYILPDYWSNICIKLLKFWRLFANICHLGKNWQSCAFFIQLQSNLTPSAGSTVVKMIYRPQADSHSLRNIPFLHCCWQTILRDDPDFDCWWVMKRVSFCMLMTISQVK